MNNKPPKKWKLAILIWLFIYPVITILSIAPIPLMDAILPIFKTLLTSAILVPIMVFVYIPFINRRFYVWMRK